MSLLRLALALAGLALLAPPALAHWADSARADLRVTGRQATLELVVPSGLLAEADEDEDGQISAAEGAKHREALEALVTEHVKVVTEAGPGEAALTAVGPDPGGDAKDPHSQLKLAYTFPEGQGAFQRAMLEYRLFAPDAPAARCLAELSVGEAYENVVLTPASPRFEAGRPEAWWQAATRFVVSGVEHILFGFDHVLFLVSLLMITGAGLWYVVQVVTAFTIAHSITLTLAVLGLVNPPGRWIEPLIALTIVWVAAENFWREDPKGRWALTFAFGLIHGFGFAGALAESGLPARHLAVSLASFNLGVELGQLTIVAAAAGLLALIRGRAFDRPLRLAVSGFVVAIGLYWFVERVLSG